VQQINTCLWFENQAEEAAKFYTSIFPDSKIGKTARYGSFAEQIGQTEGKVMTVEFSLGDRKFLALNGGPQFKFNESISFIINCESQKEIDFYWEKLSAVPQAEMCGWVKDKFGVAWQIVPTFLSELAADPEKSDRVMKAVMKMKKLNIEELKKAANQ
jgi:predicted 3-demethylubiquinone-9 3-methyltransferase (glyoxalase superfamily)